MNQQKVIFLSDGNMLKIRPIVSTEQIERIADECFGLILNRQYAPVEMDSFEDRNFVVRGK